MYQDKIISQQVEYLIKRDLEMRQEIDNLEQRCERLEDCLVSLERALDNDLYTQEEKVRRLEVDVFSLENRVMDLEAELSKNTPSTARLEETVEQIDSALGTQEEKIRQLEVDVFFLAKLLGQELLKNTHSTAQLDETVRENKELKLRVEELEKERIKLQKENYQLVDRNFDLEDAQKLFCVRGKDLEAKVEEPGSV